MLLWATRIAILTFVLFTIIEITVNNLPGRFINLKDLLDNFSLELRWDRILYSVIISVVSYMLVLIYSKIDYKNLPERFHFLSLTEKNWKQEKSSLRVEVIFGLIWGLVYVVIKDVKGIQITTEISMTKDFFYWIAIALVAIYSLFERSTLRSLIFALSFILTITIGVNFLKDMNDTITFRDPLFNYILTLIIIVIFRIIRICVNFIFKTHDFEKD